MTIALVRAPGATFSAALTGRADPVSLDLHQALAEHAGYVSALRSLGVDVVELPAEDTLPDAPFVEDCAVTIGRDALLTRPGAPSRLPEPETLADMLASRVDRLERMPEWATLDGGDVLKLGDTFFVGRSARTNEAGIDALDAFAATRGIVVVPVDVPGGYLHLQTAVTAVAPDTLIGVPEALSHPAFARVPRKLAVPPGEEPAASVLRIHDTLVMAAGFDKTEHLLREHGCQVVSTPLNEFIKADGGPTCLSLRIDQG